MVLHNPNNWHWVNKDASGWAREYLEKELIGLEVEEGGNTAKVTKVLSQDGDVDVSQRKGKVITLFDIRLQLEFDGKTKDEEAVSGTITVPEVAHDTEEDEYVFEIENYSDSLAKQPVKDLVRQSLTPQLRQKLATLGPALITFHGKDLQHTAGSGDFKSTTRYTTNTSSINTAKQADAPTEAGTSTSTSSANNYKVNVTTLTDTSEFRTTAAELFTTFTDPQRIAAFTRAAPRQWEGAQVGGAFALFDGNVSGKFTEVTEPTLIRQDWRLAQWPEGHYSKLEMKFDQNDVDRVTNMVVKWEGVPVGQEEVTKRNWETYYVRSIKTTFGFGTVL